MSADRSGVSADPDDRAVLLERYSRVMFVDSADGARERDVLLRALCRAFGSRVQVAVGVTIIHPETIEIGDGVTLGTLAFLQGRYDGRFVIGPGTSIGPLAYFSATDVEIGASVRWGPGAKVLGSEHIGEPLDIPIIQTDLAIRPVRVGEGADIGANVVLLPGVTIGARAVVRPGSVVSRDVAPNAVAEGVPARDVGSRP